MGKSQDESKDSRRSRSRSREKSRSRSKSRDASPSSKSAGKIRSAPSDEESSYSKEERRSKRSSRSKERRSRSKSKRDKTETTETESKLKEDETKKVQNDIGDRTRSIYEIHGLAQNSLLLQQFQHNVENIQFKVNTMLIPKRQLIMNQMMSIQSKIAQVKNIKESIVLETRETMDSIMSQLNSQESRKVSSLHSDMMELQNQLNEITKFVTKVTSMLELKTNDGDSQAQSSNIAMPNTTMIHTLNFLNAFDELQYECEYLSNKPFKKEIDVEISDFARDVYEFKTKDRSLEELKNVIRSQNEIIERLTREKEEVRRQKDDEIAQLYRLYLSTKRELFEWISMVDKKVR